MLFLLPQRLFDRIDDSFRRGGGCFEELVDLSSRHQIDFYPATFCVDEEFFIDEGSIKRIAQRFYAVCWHVRGRE